MGANLMAVDANLMAVERRVQVLHTALMTSTRALEAPEPLQHLPAALQPGGQHLPGERPAGHRMGNQASDSLDEAG